MSHAALAHLAAVLGALACAALLIGRTRSVVAPGLVLLAAAEVAFGVTLAPANEFSRLIHSKPHVAALVVAAIGAVALAALMVRYPAAAPLLLMLVAPFRISTSLGSEHAMLLLPLYAVLAAAGLAFAWTLVRGDVELAIPLWVAAPSALLIGLYAVSLLWASDLRAGSIELAFFLFPFSLLVAIVSRTRTAIRLTRALGIILVGQAIVFAAVGLWEETSHRVFFSRFLEVSNAYTTYFRTNSLFYDPNIYGRHLVLAIGVLVALMWRRALPVLPASLLVAVLWLSLYFSYSQSSLVTLFVVVVAITIAVGSHQARRVIVFGGAACVVVGALLAASNVHGQSLRRVTSDRSHLISVTLDAFRQHPLAGVGVGSQPLASQQDSTSSGAAKLSASHTTPLTVAAELGVVGLAAYLLWLVGAAATLRRAWRSDFTAGVSLAVVFGALLTHSLFYSGFFENPLTWGVLAVAATVPRARRRTDGLTV